MKNFTEKFQSQLQKKKEADSKTSSAKEIKKVLAKKNLKGKIVLLSANELKQRKNIRDEYDYEQIESLASDIITNGQLEPVVITSDNYLLWGYRRHRALELIVSNPDFVKNISVKKGSINKFNKLLCYQVDKLSKDISDEDLQELQLSENNERRDIDNIQLSKLYNSYLERGYSQTEICQKFGKGKAFVSAIITLKDIDKPLVKLLKEFQVYGCSKEKFIAINSAKSENLEKSSLPVHGELKKVIGWQPLYNIAKNGDDLKGQKTAFLKLFKGNLSKAELETEYFSGLASAKKDHDNGFGPAGTQIKTFLKTLDQLKDKVPSEHHKLVERVNKDISELQAILDKIAIGV